MVFLRILKWLSEARLWSFYEFPLLSNHRYPSYNVVTFSSFAWNWPISEYCTSSLIICKDRVFEPNLQFLDFLTGRTEHESNSFRQKEPWARTFIYFCEPNPQTRNVFTFFQNFRFLNRTEPPNIYFDLKMSMGTQSYHTCNIWLTIGFLFLPFFIIFHQSLQRSNFITKDHLQFSLWSFLSFRWKFFLTTAQYVTTTMR